MSGEIRLPLTPVPSSGRRYRDQLELLTALLNGPAVDPIFRSELIRIPTGHPVYLWQCVVEDCVRPISKSPDLCSQHATEWSTRRKAGVSRAEFLRTATALGPSQVPEGTRCRICPDRPASTVDTSLCDRHYTRWLRHGANAAVAVWAAAESPYPGYGVCLVVICPELASTPLGLCERHEHKYNHAGRPGGGALPLHWSRVFEWHGLATPVEFTDESAFRRWCADAAPLLSAGQLNLRRLPPLLRAELQWGLLAHTQGRHSVWQLYWIQSLIDFCRIRGLQCVADIDLDTCTHMGRMIAREIRESLRLVYFTPADTREAGFLETDHFGVRFPGSAGHFDLTEVSQRWLRDLLWDQMVERLRTADPPRARGVFDNLRRAAVELSAFLEAEAPHGGHKPETLRERDMIGLVSDLRRRAREGMPSRGLRRVDGAASTVTDNNRRAVFNHARQLLHSTLTSGEVERLGLDRKFVAALPSGGKDPKRARSPFPDDVARALAAEDNLRQLAMHDVNDRGMRDMWETIVLTGRRASEVITVRWDCVGRINGAAMFWHDQTKVNNFDQAIRIPDWHYDRLRERQATTEAWFTAWHGRRPRDTERAHMALFASNVRNPDGTRSMSYGWFQNGFQAWVKQLDLGGH